MCRVYVLILSNIQVYTMSLGTPDSVYYKQAVRKVLDSRSSKALKAGATGKTRILFRTCANGLALEAHPSEQT